jgi:hypothetical protein
VAPSPQDLAHVVWIAGSPCSGKSTISHTLARIHVVVDYHVDAWARNHFARRIAAGDQEASVFIGKTLEQRWLLPSAQDLANETIRSWTADLALVLEDVLALPRENLILAEGNFFPVSVAPYLSSRHQAIWLVPTPTFLAKARREKHDTLAIRQKRYGLYGDASDADRRLEKLIARDTLLAQYVKQQAQAFDLPLVEVDGSRSRDELAEVVERYLDPYLSALFRGLPD